MDNTLADNWIQSGGFAALSDTILTGFDTIPGVAVEELIIYLLRGNPKITQQMLCQQSASSLSTVKRIMLGLQNQGKISRKGNNRTGYW